MTGTLLKKLFLVFSLILILFSVSSNSGKTYAACNYTTSFSLTCSGTGGASCQCDNVGSCAGNSSCNGGRYLYSQCDCDTVAEARGCACGGGGCIGDGVAANPNAPSGGCCSANVVNGICQPPCLGLETTSSTCSRDGGTWKTNVSNFSCLANALTNNLCSTAGCPVNTTPSSCSTNAYGTCLWQQPPTRTCNYCDCNSHYLGCFATSPAAASQVSPTKNATGVALSPRLEWSDVNFGTGCPEIDNYFLYVWKTSNPSGTTSTYVEPSGHSYHVLSNLSTCTQYQWRVDSYNGSFITTGTTQWKFTTFDTGGAACPGNCPPLASPLGPFTPTSGSTVTPGPTLFSWSPVTGATSYILTLNDLTNGTQIVSTVTGNSTSISLTAGHSYSWSVQSSYVCAGTGADVNSLAPTTNSVSVSNIPYFQVVGGPASAIGNLQSVLPVSSFLSASSSGHLDSGIISGSTINLGSGAFSQVNTPPGANRTAVTNPYPNIAKLSYANLYTTVLTNAGVNPTANLSANCNAALGYFDSGFYRFFCYNDGSDLATKLNGVSTSATSTNVLIPFPGVATANNPTIGNLSVNGKKFVVFANSTVANGTVLPATITVAANNTSGLVIIVNGDINAANTTQMDGLYIFSGTLNSGGGPSQLLGNGSLIGTGTTPFNFTRTYGTTGATNPAEKWTYQGKYLWLFRGVISSPAYTWREQAPQ